MDNAMSRTQLSDGLVAFVKRDCPTCELVEPVLASMQSSADLTVFTQDDPTFPEGVKGVIDDTTLEQSWHNNIETVPTLIRVADGVEVDRIVGWERSSWEAFTGLEELGVGIQDWSPGCGSLSVHPDNESRLVAEFAADRLSARQIELGQSEDPFETMFDRGWSDGLPLIPPTDERVHRMLAGTSRSPDDLVAIVPPDLVECTVEKVAINAVMAGCRPEYLPVVLAALEAVCTDEFNMHGLLATTMPVGPVIVVNGPIRQHIGMNSGLNVFGQGNRANLTIGRALQLTIRNVGGGRPGEVDRATHGSPAKLSFCFAEDEEGSPWDSLAQSRGFEADESTVTLFGGEAPHCVVDQLARTPEELVTTFAHALRSLYHPKLPMAFDAMLAISPDHARVFADAGWDRERLLAEIDKRVLLSADEIARGAGGMAEGVPEAFAGVDLPKFRPGGILIVHCGGGAGLFSSLIGGWVNGETGSNPVTRTIQD
jgi:hypothetical protein